MIEPRLGFGLYPFFPDLYPLCAVLIFLIELFLGKSRDLNLYMS